MTATAFAPHTVAARYGGTAKRLDEWRRRGWLGLRGKGSGHNYPWYDPRVADQIRWLNRLQSAGKILDDEDAAAGFRLRASGATMAVRPAGCRWVPVDRHDDWAELDVPYTLAFVR